jgi:hypothetical protein
MIDSGLVLQKIVIETRWPKETCSGAPQSVFIK